MRSLQKFSDPAHWDHIEYGVPIFVPHRVPHIGADGSEREIAVDEARLKRIADRINAVYQRRGVPLRFQSGHTRDPKTTGQSDQPAILAYGRNARIGPPLPDGTPTLRVDMYVRKGKFPEVQELPFRSAEFYDQTDDLTAVALLRTDPRLDMGALIYGADQGSECIHYSRSGTTWVFFGKQLGGNPMFEKKDTHDEKPAMFGEGFMGEDNPDDDFKKKFYGCMSGYMSEKYPALDRMHAEYASANPPAPAPAVTSPTNGTLPPTNPPMPDEKPGAGYSRGSTPAQYERQILDLTERLMALESENAASKKALAQREQATHYERELQRLKNDGYQFDYELELADSLDLANSLPEEKSKVHFQKRLERIATYQRAPLNRPMLDTTGNAPNGKPVEFTREHMLVATQYQRDNNLWGEEGFAKAKQYALEKLNGKRK